MHEQPDPSKNIPPTPPGARGGLVGSIGVEGLLIRSGRGGKLSASPAVRDQAGRDGSVPEFVSLPLRLNGSWTTGTSIDVMTGHAHVAG